MAKNNADFNGSKNPNYKHGKTYGANGKLHPIFNSWRAMISRCTNNKDKSFKYYGEKGIDVCAEWKTYYNFYKWAISNKWGEGLVIDRIDAEKDYCPENCRWITKSENSTRRNKNKISKDQAVEIHRQVEMGANLSALARQYKVTPQYIWMIKENRVKRLVKE